MKTYQPTGLGRSIVGFFQEYLPTLRGMSRHTIQSYRDGLVLFLQFAATDCDGRPSNLSKLPTSLPIGSVGSWLSWKPHVRTASPPAMHGSPLCIPLRASSSRETPTT